MKPEKNECSSCLKLWDDSQLKKVVDLIERVQPGETMPSGECPECGFLCHPVTVEYEFVPARKMRFRVACFVDGTAVLVAGEDDLVSAQETAIKKMNVGIHEGMRIEGVEVFQFKGSVERKVLETTP